MRRATSPARPATSIDAHTAENPGPTRHIGLTSPRNAESLLDYVVPELDYLSGSPGIEGTCGQNIRAQTDLIAAAADFYRSPRDLSSPPLDLRRGSTEFALPAAEKIAGIDASLRDERHFPLT